MANGTQNLLKFQDVEGATFEDIQQNEALRKVFSIAQTPEFDVGTGTFRKAAGTAGRLRDPGETNLFRLAQSQVGKLGKIGFAIGQTERSLAENFANAISSPNPEDRARAPEIKARLEPLLAEAEKRYIAAGIDPATVPVLQQLRSQIQTGDRDAVISSASPLDQPRGTAPEDLIHSGDPAAAKRAKEQLGGRLGTTPTGITQVSREGDDFFVTENGQRRSIELDEFKQLGINKDFVKSGSTVSLSEATTGRAPSVTGDKGTETGVDGQEPTGMIATPATPEDPSGGETEANMLPTDPTAPGGGGPPVIYTPPSISNGNNSYVKQWNSDTQNWDVFDAAGNHVKLDQFKSLGLNIDHLNTPELLESEFKAAGMLTDFGSSQGPEQFRNDPMAAFESSYQEITTAMGLDGIKGQMEGIIDALQEVENNRADAIQEVDNNPWLSEALRSKKIKNINTKFDARRSAQVEELELLQGLYDRGRDDAKFIAENGLRQFNKDREFAQDQLEFRLERADKLREATKRDTTVTTGAGGRRLLIDKQTGEVIADLGMSSRAPAGSGSGLSGLFGGIGGLGGAKLGFEEWKRKFFSSSLGKIQSGKLSKDTVAKQNQIFTEEYQDYLSNVPGAAGVTGKELTREQAEAALIRKDSSLSESERNALLGAAGFSQKSNITRSSIARIFGIDEDDNSLDSIMAEVEILQAAGVSDKDILKQI